MVQGTITTAPDKNSSTILFIGEDTPSEAYEWLTDAVYSAKYTDGYVQINIDEIPPNTELGTATYDETSKNVTQVNLHEHILNTYGVKND